MEETFCGVTVGYGEKAEKSMVRYLQIEMKRFIVRFVSTTVISKEDR